MNLIFNIFVLFEKENQAIQMLFHCSKKKYLIICVIEEEKFENSIKHTHIYIE